MGICAQQHRVCVGLYQKCAFRCVPTQKGYESLVPGWKDVLCFFDVAGTALNRFLCFVILMFILFETIKYSEEHEGDKTDCTPSTNLRTFLELIIDSLIAYMMYSYIKSNCNYVRLSTLKVITAMSIFTLFFLNILLLLICNPSIANPGPVKLKELTVYYQNIRGFVGAGKGLTDPSPVLNRTKINEFEGYVYMSKPDIICITETWLWGEFGDSEILKPDSYKIYRLDRSRKTHPIDPFTTA